MSEVVYCLDTGVWIVFLLPEGPPSLRDAVDELVLRALREGRLVAPTFAWAEVGSVLRKKRRQGLVSEDQAHGLWGRFVRMPIDYVDSPALRARSWDLATNLGLPTLYDAAFLACTEVAPAPTVARREFWTLDDALYLGLGGRRPPYVRRLGHLSGMGDG